MMRLPILFAIMLTSAILLSSALFPFQLNSIYADEFDSDSINSNCEGNSIDSSASIICGGLPIGNEELKR
jgi:hypothetical protein